MLNLYQDWVCNALYKQKNQLFFSDFQCKLWNKFAAVLFQKRETKQTLVSTRCFETRDPKQWIDDVNEVLSSMVKYFYKVYFEKD